jgi:hypothetical protein
MSIGPSRRGGAARGAMGLHPGAAGGRRTSLGRALLIPAGRRANLLEGGMPMRLNMAWSASLGLRQYPI